VACNAFQPRLQSLGPSGNLRFLYTFSGRQTPFSLKAHL